MKRYGFLALMMFLTVFTAVSAMGESSSDEVASVGTSSENATSEEVTWCSIQPPEDFGRSTDEMETEPPCNPDYLPPDDPNYDPKVAECCRQTIVYWEECINNGYGEYSCFYDSYYYMLACVFGD